MGVLTHRKVEKKHIWRVDMTGRSWEGHFFCVDCSWRIEGQMLFDGHPMKPMPPCPYIAPPVQRVGPRFPVLDF